MMTAISSLDSKRLCPYKTLGNPEAHRDRGQGLVGPVV